MVTTNNNLPNFGTHQSNPLVVRRLPIGWALITHKFMIGKQLVDHQYPLHYFEVPGFTNSSDSFIKKIPNILLSLFISYLKMPIIFILLKTPKIL